MYGTSNTIINHASIGFQTLASQIIVRHLLIVRQLTN